MFAMQVGVARKMFAKASAFGMLMKVSLSRHVFHKTCVDPWLLEHRTCPMCKSDILKAFGYHVNVSGRRRTQFSAQVEGRNGGRGIEHDRISMDGHSSASESNAYPFPVVSEIHDPFSFTTAPAPQVVQVSTEIVRQPVHVY